jgi:hypothetical protein
MSQIWAGTDCGKTHHHCLVLDNEGATLLSRRVTNDEPELLKLIDDVLDLADGEKDTCALDMAGGGPGLLIGMLVNHGQELVYDRKRAEGKRHVQAVLALARRRVNVLWALIRDRRCYQVTPPVAAPA